MGLFARRERNSQTSDNLENKIPSGLTKRSKRLYTSVPPMILKPREPSSRANNTSTTTSSAVCESKANLKVSRLKSKAHRMVYIQSCLFTYNLIKCRSPWQEKHSGVRIMAKFERNIFHSPQSTLLFELIARSSRIGSNLDISRIKNSRKNSFRTCLGERRLLLASLRVA